MTQTLDQIWASGDLRSVFGAGLPKVLCPWPRAARRKHEPGAASAVTGEFVSADVRLAHVDPRRLRCSQKWVLLEHTRYYRTGIWERTGVTSADRHVAANRYPIVVNNTSGELVIVTGHHRALAALIDGRPLLCRRLPVGIVSDDAVTVLPHLLHGTSTDLPVVCCDDADRAVAAVMDGDIALVSSRAAAIVAAAVLRETALPPDSTTM